MGTFGTYDEGKAEATKKLIGGNPTPKRKSTYDRKEAAHKRLLGMKPEKTKDEAMLAAYE